MSGAWRRQAAACVLAATTLPWAAALALSLHAILEVHQHDDDHDIGSAVAEHGHEHEAGTPAHRHLSPPPARALASVRLELARTAPAVTVPATIEGAQAPALWVCSARGAGPDPPRPRSSASILRI